jgi:hypothetical protein
MPPMAQGPPESPPKEAKTKVIEGKLLACSGEKYPLIMKTLSDWPFLRIVRSTRTDQVPFYWASRSQLSK